jgi:SagB-type dehydrogenase family enzyme
MFRDQYPAAWLFHHNTIRWPFNTLDPEEEAWAGPPFKEYPAKPVIEMPAPLELNLPLGRAIRRRLSCRSFKTSPLMLSQLSTILAVGNGIEGVVQLGANEHLERPMPSGGGLYPLEFYPIVRRVEGLAPGLYHYAPLTHQLEELKLMEFADSVISQLFMNQPYLAGAAVVLLISAVLERSMHKYGERGYRYILLETGHAAQNMCLAAASMDLGALPVGGFFDSYVAELLELNQDQEALLYALGFGEPTTDDRVEVRNLAALLGV